MNNTLRSYFAASRHHVTNPAYKARAVDFITSYMTNDLKLDVRIDEFTPITQNVSVTSTGPDPFWGIISEATVGCNDSL